MYLFNDWCDTVLSLCRVFGGFIWRVCAICLDLICNVFRVICCWLFGCYLFPACCGCALWVGIAGLCCASLGWVCFGRVCVWVHLGVGLFRGWW